MSDRLLEAMISQAAEPSDRVQLLWHGGEPLLAGAEFFEKVEDLQRRASASFSNFIQTNGTLLNPSWAALLARMNFRIRLSLDGPRVLHDRCRSNNAGRGSHQDVEASIRMLQDHGFDPQVSCVISNDSADQIGEVYDYFASLGIRQVSFLPSFLMTDGVVHPQTLTPTAYVRSYLELFDRWSSDTREVRVRELEGIVDSFLGRPSGDCTWSGHCASVVRIEPNGSIFPCELHSGAEGECYGTLVNESLETILGRRAGGCLGCRLDGIRKECSTCEWYHSCRGGCPAQYVTTAKDTKEFYYCAARKRLLAELTARLESKGAELQCHKASISTTKSVPQMLSRSSGALS